MRLTSLSATLLFLALALFTLPTISLAQSEEGDDVDALLEEGAAAADATDKELRQELPEIGEGKLQDFKLQRGFYLAADVGMSMSFSGVNSYSNAQPYLGVAIGFDFNDYVGLQLVLSQHFISDNAPSNVEFQLNGLQTASYSVFGAGLEVPIAIRPTERIGLTFRPGGGLGRTDPPLTDAPGVPFSRNLPYAGFGIDVNYLTLLTGFTAGIGVGVNYLIGPNIPLGHAALTLRYTM